MQILKAPSLHSSFSPIFCSTNSSCISSLELQLSLFNSPRPWFSDWLLPPVLLCRNCLQAESWTNHSAHLIGCPSLRGHRTLLQDPTSKNSNFIYFFLVLWLLVMGGLMQHRYHSWPEAGISPLLFHSQFLLSDLQFYPLLRCFQGVIFGILFIRFTLWDELIGSMASIIINMLRTP